MKKHKMMLKVLAFAGLFVLGTVSSVMALPPTERFVRLSALYIS